MNSVLIIYLGKIWTVELIWSRAKSEWRKTTTTSFGMVSAGVGISLPFSKSTKEAARLNIPIRQKNRYQQYICLHITCTVEGFGI